MNRLRQTGLASALSVALATVAVPAHAQKGASSQTNSGSGIGPSNQVSTPAFQDPSSVLPTVEHLFGDWGGLRTGLLAHGIDLAFDNTNEFASNISGGTKQNTTNAGQSALEVDIDWDKLAGIKGFATHTVIIGRYGASTSNGFGDTLSPVQEIYGASGAVFAKLVYFYGEERLLGDHLAIAAGRFPVGTDFASSPLNCTFMNNILCGNPKELVGNVAGFSAWPSSTWGVRARYRPVAQVYVQAAIFEVSRAVYGNEAGYRTNWTLNTDRDAGGEFPMEIGWEPEFGPNKLAGHYKFGMAWDTSSYPVFGEDIAGGPIDLTKKPQKWERNHGQFWVLLDQMLVRNGSGASDGLIALAGYVHSDPAVVSREDQVYVGLYDRNFWSKRPKDIIGLLYTHQTMSGRLSGEQALEQQDGLAFANSASGVQRYQDLLELNYTIHVLNGVSFEPDFQYVFRPNAQQNIPDAAVLGFKSHISF